MEWHEAQEIESKAKRLFVDQAVLIGTTTRGDHHEVIISTNTRAEADAIAEWLVSCADPLRWS